MKISLAVAIAATALAGAEASTDPIIGGTAVPTDNYKFLTSLQTTAGRHFCGGSLIAPNVVLTAAHCVSNGNTNFQVRLGTTDLRSNRGVTVRPRRVYVNSAYNPRNIRNDIAVIELSSSVSGISPINMDKSGNTHQGGSATVAGWGLTSGGASSTPLQMREVTIPIVDDRTCRNAQPTFAQTLTESMICTGFRNGRQGSCNGDSGGPLFQGNTQIGLVSWGLRGCISYSVFTQVNSFRSWIEARLVDINGNTGGGGRGGGGPQPCKCIGTGTDVGATCGNWLNAGFNWCYSDEVCPGSTPSQRYPGLHWFRCTRSRFDLFSEMDDFSVNHPVVTETGSEDFFLAGSQETAGEPAAPADNSGSLLAGVGVGAGVMGIAAMAVFMIYRQQREAKVDMAIERVELERRSAQQQCTPADL